MPKIILEGKEHTRDRPRRGRGLDCRCEVGDKATVSRGFIMWNRDPVLIHSNYGQAMVELFFSSKKKKPRPSRG